MSEESLPKKGPKVKFTPEELREHHRIASLRWYRANKEKSLVRVREWQKNNQDRIKAARKIWRIVAKDKKTATDRAWTARNKERIAKSMSAWRKTPKGIASNRHWHAKRKAIERGCVFTATKKETDEFLKKAKSCKYCGRKFTKTVRATLDHIIPMAKGGAHALDNFCAACTSCNCKKKDKHPHKFAREIGLLLI